MSGRPSSHFIVFRVAEDIRSASQSLLLSKKGFELQFVVSRPRLLRSYCHEFCGREDVDFSVLRFSANGREADLDSEVRTSTAVLVFNRDAPSAAQPGNLLKNALFALKSTGAMADLELSLPAGRTIRAHRFLLNVPGLGPCLHALALSRFCLARKLTTDSELPTW